MGGDQDPEIACGFQKSKKRKGRRGKRIKETHFTMEGVGLLKARGNVAFIRDMPCWFQFTSYAYT